MAPAPARSRGGILSALIPRLADGHCHKVVASEERETLADINIQEARGDCAACTCPTCHPPSP